MMDEYEAFFDEYVEKNLKDDIAYLMRPLDYNVEFYEIIKKKIHSK